MPFEEVLHLSQAIWECASGKRVRKITLFDHLGKSPDSGPSRFLITSSSKYGLTTGGYQAEYLELTDDGAKASNPDGIEQEIVEARFKLAIQGNKFFNHLYESYKNMKVPSNKVLEDCIIEFGIQQHEAKQCVETFIVNASQMHAPHTSAHVNNQGMCIENPFEDLQKTIDSKNKKFEQYKKNCDECDLLVVVENGFVHLSDKLQKHKFDSVFRDVYVQDLSYGCKVTKLKLRKKKNEL